MVKLPNIQTIGILLFCLWGLRPFHSCSQSANRDELFNSALANQQAGKHKEAIDAFSIIIDLNPRDLLSYFNRAASLQKLGFYEKAIADYNKVLSLNSKYTQAIVNRAIAKSGFGMVEEAVNDLKRVIRKTPTYLEAYMARGQILMENNKPKEAAADFGKAITLAPDNQQAYFFRAQATSLQGFTYNAIDDYNKLIALSPNSKEAFNSRGMSECRVGQYADAANDFSMAIMLDAKNSAAWNNRGLANNNLGKYPEAIADFKKAIELDSTDGYPVVNIISPLIRSRNYKDAIAYFDKLQADHLVSFITDKSWAFYTLFVKSLRMIENGSPSVQVLDTIRLAKSLYQSEGQQHVSKAVMNRAFSDILTVEASLLVKEKKFEDAIKVYGQALIFSKDQPDVLKALDAIGSIYNNQPFTIKYVTLPSDTIVVRNSSADSITIIAQITDISGIHEVTINDRKVSTVNTDNIFLFKFLPHNGYNDITINFRDQSGNYFSGRHDLFGVLPNSSMTQASSNSISEYDSTPPRYKAILIAEQTYADALTWPPLKNPISNAKSLYNILVNQYEFLPKNIDTMYDQSKEDVVQRIINVSDESEDPEKGYDNLLIFYAGHGFARKIEKGYYQGFIIPTTAKSGIIPSYISSSEIGDAIATCHSRHVLFIADACFSGSLLKSGTPGIMGSGAPPGTVGPDAPVFYNRLYNYDSRKILTSGNIEPSPDNSVFLKAIISHLASNTDKYYPANTLFSQIRQEVYASTPDTPQYRDFNNMVDQGGEFIFKKKNGIVPR